MHQIEYLWQKLTCEEKQKYNTSTLLPEKDLLQFEIDTSFEAAFELYLKICKSIHEKQHPGFKYDEVVFEELAVEKWNSFSKDEKDFFQSKLAKEEKNEQPLKNETPFSAFSRQKRTEIQKTNPDMKPYQVMCQIEYLWQNLPCKEKQKYNLIGK